MTLHRRADDTRRQAVPGEPSDNHLRTALERNTLDLFARIFVAALFVTAAIVLNELRSGRASASLLLLGTSMLGCALGLRRQMPHRIRAGAFVVGTWTLGLTALVQFGPLLGTGALLSVAPVGAALFFGARAGFATVGLTCLAVVCVGGLASAEVVAVYWDVPSPLVWVRIAVTTCLALVAVVSLFESAHQIRESSLSMTLAAAERERALDLERVQARELAQRSQQLAALGRLSGSVAHELNTSLAVIRSQVDLVRTESDSKVRSELLDEMAGASDRAAGAVSQVLHFARRAPEVDGRCSPAETVQRFAVAMKHLLSDATKIEVACTSNDIVRLPSSALDQALLHAVLEAQDAMVLGGTIVLGVHARDDEVWVEVTDARPKAVSDRPTGGALGRDLAFSRIAARAGGRVEIDGRNGSHTVRLCLPSMPAPADQASVPAPSKPAGARFLLLEDERDMRRAFERLFRRWGHQVDGFASAAEASQALAGQSYDLLITDATVPGGGVPELIRAFNAACPGRPVVVCSGHIDEDNLLDGIDRGEFAFIAKPFQADELRKLLDGVLAAGAADTRS